MQKRVGHLRWAIAILLGIGVVINYLDRVNVSVATQPLEQTFHLSAGEMGIVLSSFLWSYALLQIPIGALLDRVGVKWLVRLGTIQLFVLHCLLAPLSRSARVKKPLTGVILVIGILCYVFLLGRIEQIQAPAAPGERAEQPGGTRVA